MTKQTFRMYRCDTEGFLSDWGSDRGPLPKVNPCFVCGGPMKLLPDGMTIEEILNKYPL